MQTKSLLQTPIDALKSILEATSETITFRTNIWEYLNEQVLWELRIMLRLKLMDYNRSN